MPKTSKGHFESAAMRRETDVSDYLAQALGAPLLTHEGVIALAKRIENGDEQARADMIFANLRLVVHIAKKYRGRGVEFADLIEAGNIGLMRAVQDYDHRRGYRFSTYAGWWIKQALQNEIQDNSRHVRLPSYMFQNRSDIKKAVAAFRAETGRNPSIEEISEKTKLKPRAIKACFEAFSRKPLSVDHVNEDGFGILDTLESDDMGDLDVVLRMEAQCETGVALQLLLDCLTDIERAVIAGRFGLFREKPMPLKEIGAEIGLSRERIRQIEGEALKKMAARSRRDDRFRTLNLD